MESLEDALKNVEDLKGKMTAEKVVRPGYTIPAEISWAYDNWSVSTDQYVSDETEADTGQKESAKAQLKQICASSEWYSARYAAGKAMGLPTDQLNLQVKKQIADLENRRHAVIILQEEISHFEDYQTAEQVCDGWSVGFRTHYDTESKKIIDQPRIEKPNIEVQRNADSDLTILISMLPYQKKRELYKHPNQDFRKKAAIALGYSNLRIWFHEFFLQNR